VRAIAPDAVVEVAEVASGKSGRTALVSIDFDVLALPSIGMDGHILISPYPLPVSTGISNLGEGIYLDMVSQGNL